MTNSTDARPAEQLLREAQAQLAQGAVIQAMQIFYELHQRFPQRIDVLQQLVDLNLQLNALDHAIVNLQKLIQIEPTTTRYYDHLASVYNRVGMWDSACNVYQALISQRPYLPEARFNLGYYQRRAGKFVEAIDSYERALTANIDNPEEVHLNIAVILADDLRQEDRAEEKLLQIIETDNTYLPAHYNLANLYEDRGEKAKAIGQFEQILAIDENHPKALARLINLLDTGERQKEVQRKLVVAATSGETDVDDKTDICYALGQLCDTAGEFDAAFDYYQHANKFNAVGMPVYDAAQTEQTFDEIIETFSSDWITRQQCKSEASLVFIFGMFRSGSTLVEQILSSHPAVTAGGENDSLVRALGEHSRRPFPANIVELPVEELQKYSDSYVERIRGLFPDASGYLTDKRPDNFRLAGLIKALFPKAKFIYTTRNPLDNCLSIYFVRLAHAMNYSTSLDHIAHYYKQQQRLLAHWQSIFARDITVVNYDKLVQNSRSEIASLLDFLSLDWNEDVLSFHERHNVVKTASAWQVRKPLYQSSNGRFKNYSSHLSNLMEHFPDMDKTIAGTSNG